MNSGAPVPWATGRRGLRGYVTHQEFGGLRIPVPVQTLVIRDYAAKNNLVFELSVGEYFFSNCYVQLEGLLSQLKELAGVGMCSLFMLPKNAQKRRAVYERFISDRSALHLIFENLVIRNQEDTWRAEELIRYKEILADCPKSLPAELLPPLKETDRFA